MNTTKWDVTQVTVGEMRQAIAHLPKGQTLWLVGLHPNNWWYINPKTENLLGVPKDYIFEMKRTKTSLELIVHHA